MKRYLFFIACVLSAWTAAAQSVPHAEKQQAASSVDLVYEGQQITQLAVPPTFKKKGFEKYQQWVFSRIEYPVELKPSRAEGTVLVKLIVETDGSVTVDEVIKSPHQGLTDVVMQIINSSPRWSPGMMRDDVSGELIPVRVAYQLPIDFKFKDPDLGGNVTGQWQSNKNLKPYGSSNDW